MPKKVKPKPRTWKMKGWVAVPIDRLGYLSSADLGDACRYGLCGGRKSVLFAWMRLHNITQKTHTPLKLDIVATARR